MSISIVPSLGLDILPDLVVILGDIQNRHVQISNDIALFSTHTFDRSNKRKHDPRHSEERITWTRSVGENDGTCVFEAATCQCRVEEETLAVGVYGEAGG